MARQETCINNVIDFKKWVDKPKTIPRIVALMWDRKMEGAMDMVYEALELIGPRFDLNPFDEGAVIALVTGLAVEEEINERYTGRNRTIAQEANKVLTDYEIGKVQNLYDSVSYRNDIEDHSDEIDHFASELYLIMSNKGPNTVRNLVSAYLEMGEIEASQFAYLGSPLQFKLKTS